tara:strand:- start:1734 stop:2708 length:975 start_codon:yes stop_codon:yes gene_type:complete
MDNDKNLEIVSEILQGVTVVRGSFGSLYFRHLSQVEQREVISESKFFEKEAISKGLLKKEDALEDLINQEMWSLENEEKIKKLKQELDGLKKILVQTFLPSKKKQMLEKAKEKEQQVFSMENEKNELLGLTAEKYANNKIQKNIVNKILFYDREFKRGVFDDLYINEGFKEAEIYKLQKEFFEKFQDSSISKAVLSDYFSMYLPFCEDVLGVFGKPLAELTSYQLKLISFGRYFLNIFKNSQKDIPENIAKDPELLVDFYQSQKSDSDRKAASSGDGGSTYFGATKEDIESIKKEDENAVVLSEEIKKKGGSLNMQQMMELHGL